MKENKQINSSIFKENDKVNKIPEKLKLASYKQETFNKLVIEKINEIIDCLIKAVR